MDFNVWLILVGIAVIGICTKLIMRKRKPIAQDQFVPESAPVVEESYSGSVDLPKAEIEAVPTPKLEDLKSPDSEKPFAKLKMTESGKAEISPTTEATSPSTEAPKPKRVYKKRTPKPKPEDKSEDKA